MYKQTIKGVIKPTQQAYGSTRVVRNIRLDNPTEHTLQQAIEILSGTDRVSIGLLVRRAITLYGAALLNNPETYREAERQAVRKGARIATKAKALKQSSAA